MVVHVICYNCSHSCATEDFIFSLYRMCNSKYNTDMSLFVQFLGFQMSTVSQSL